VVSLLDPHGRILVFLERNSVGFVRKKIIEISSDCLCDLVVLAKDPEVRVRFPALPDFLRSKMVCNGVHSAS
jgi:hypothetical protein